MTLYLAVVPFDRDRAGALVRGEMKRVPSIEAATRGALELSFGHAGALAFRRTVDPASGALGEGRIVAAYGEVDDAVLREAGLF